MVRLGVSSNGVRTRLPDAGGEVKACLWVWDTIPVENQLCKGIDISCAFPVQPGYDLLRHSVLLLHEPGDPPRKALETR